MRRSLAVPILIGVALVLGSGAWAAAGSILTPAATQGTGGISLLGAIIFDQSSEVLGALGDETVLLARVTVGLSRNAEIFAELSNFGDRTFGGGLKVALLQNSRGAVALFGRVLWSQPGGAVDENQVTGTGAVLLSAKLLGQSPYVGLVIDAFSSEALAAGDRLKTSAVLGIQLGGLPLVVETNLAHDKLLALGARISF